MYLTLTLGAFGCVFQCEALQVWDQGSSHFWVSFRVQLLFPCFALPLDDDQEGGGREEAMESQPLGSLWEIPANQNAAMSAWLVLTTRGLRV